MRTSPAVIARLPAEWQAAYNANLSEAAAYKPEVGFLRITSTPRSHR